MELDDFSFTEADRMYLEEYCKEMNSKAFPRTHFSKSLQAFLNLAKENLNWTIYPDENNKSSLSEFITEQLQEIKLNYPFDIIEAENV
jgi:hypothetical protein